MRRKRQAAFARSRAPHGGGASWETIIDGILVSAVLEREDLEIAPGEAWLVVLGIEDRHVRVKEKARVSNEGRLVWTVRVDVFPAQRLVELTAWVDDVLVLHAQPEIGHAFPPSGHEALEGGRLQVFDGRLAPGRRRLRLEVRVLVAGEVEPRVRIKERELDLRPGEVARVELALGPEDPTPRPEQSTKLADLRVMEAQIAETIRAGREFLYADGEGLWERYTCADGSFVCVSGFRSGEGTQERIGSTRELIHRLVGRSAFPLGPPLDALRSIVDALTPGR